MDAVTHYSITWVFNYQSYYHHMVLHNACPVKKLDTLPKCVEAKAFASIPPPPCTPQPQEYGGTKQGPVIPYPQPGLSVVPLL